MQLQLLKSPGSYMMRLLYSDRQEQWRLIKRSCVKFICNTKIKMQRNYFRGNASFDAFPHIHFKRTETAWNSKSQDLAGTDTQKKDILYVLSQLSRLERKLFRDFTINYKSHTSYRVMSAQFFTALESQLCEEAHERKIYIFHCRCFSYPLMWLYF